MTAEECVPFLSVRERWLSFRNSLISNRRFQRFAFDFPLTRPIARRNARALFDLVAGFVYSQILAACIELDLFVVLEDSPLSTAAVASRLQLSGEAAGRLLKAAAALDLVQSLPDGRYGLGRLGAALRGNPSLPALIKHHAMLYADLADPVALLRGQIQSPQLKAFWAYAGNNDAATAAPEQVNAYSALMADSQSLIAADVLDAYPLGRHSMLLDIGGGEGVFLQAAAVRYPKLRVILFDLPAVAERAAQRFAEAGLAARASVVGGDFFREALPIGADVVSLIRLLHDHDDSFALAILRKAYDSLPAGGTLLIAEPLAGTPGAVAVGDAYFGFYFAAMGTGRPRSFEEIRHLLAQAGFSNPRLVQTRLPMVVSLITASA
jgi:demethylspheroidene O-methyltransferase